ncbi:GNAT family N-acetyltransferase [Paenibacillus ihumii]|uniref:GNAT family N-acetyltransferase n=1 Tax=Paenibacillus ihumii TaxID=687436 RepID=UPI0006D7EEB3|nr:GNAT family protein [Paenibacillus ihumii]
MTNNVSLREYLPGDMEALERYELPEGQILFSALPKEVLSEAIQDSHRYPVVIVCGESLVGFFILHEGPAIAEFTPNPQAMLLRSFSIDYRHQGQGIAKQAMLQLPEFMKSRFPGRNEIVLAVNKRNKAAQTVYLAAGFRDEGRLIEGPIGPQHIYHLIIA